MREFFEKLFERNSLNRKLHWTTIASEKVILALVGILTVYASAAFIYELALSRSVELSDLFLCFASGQTLGRIGPGSPTGVSGRQRYQLTGPAARILGVCLR